jgi:hypothetical protein
MVPRGRRSAARRGWVGGPPFGGVGGGVLDAGSAGRRFLVCFLSGLRGEGNGALARTGPAWSWWRRIRVAGSARTGRAQPLDVVGCLDRETVAGGGFGVSPYSRPNDTRGTEARQADATSRASLPEVPDISRNQPSGSRASRWRIAGPAISTSRHGHERSPRVRSRRSPGAATGASRAEAPRASGQSPAGPAPKPAGPACFLAR